MIILKIFSEQYNVQTMISVHEQKEKRFNAYIVRGDLQQFEYPLNSNLV